MRVLIIGASYDDILADLLRNGISVLGYESFSSISGGIPVSMFNNEEQIKIMSDAGIDVLCIQKPWEIPEGLMPETIITIRSQLVSGLNETESNYDVAVENIIRARFENPSVHEFDSTDSIGVIEMVGEMGLECRSERLSEMSVATA